MTSRQIRYGFRCYVHQWVYSLWWYEIGFPNRYGRWIPVLISGPDFKTADDCLKAAIKAQKQVEAAYKKRKIIDQYKKQDGIRTVEDGA